MDTNCLRCRQFLSAAMDGEATSNELAFVQQHILTCPDCREAQAAYNSLRSRMQALRQPLPPPQLKMAVMARINGGRAIGLNRRPVAGLHPWLSFGQKLTVGLAASVVLLIGGLIIWGILRTPPFEVVDQEANLADQKLVVVFSQPVDQEYIMAHASELFTVKDENGTPVPISPDEIKINDDGKKVEITLQPGMVKPDETSIQVDVKPDLKAKDGKSLKNPGLKEAKVLPPAPLTATTTPRPTLKVIPPATSAAAKITPVNPTTTPSITEPAVTPTLAAPTVVPPPATGAALPTATAPATQRPTLTPAPSTVAPTIPVTTVPTTTVMPTTPPDTVPVTTTVTVAPTTTPELTVTPDVTNTPPPPTPTPTLRSDACSVALRRGFGKLYNDRADIAAKIGCPVVEEAQASLVYQPFQRGFMVWYKQTGQIYIFYSNSGGQGTWVRMRDPGPGDLPTPVPVSPGGTPVPTITPTPTPATGCSFSPVRGFGNIWSTQPTVRNAIGCPLSPETGTDGAAFQSFERGLMFFNPIANNGRRVYVLYNDTTYLDVLDTFVG